MSFVVIITSVLRVFWVCLGSSLDLWPFEELQLRVGPQQIFSKCSRVLSSGVWLICSDLIYSLAKNMLVVKEGSLDTHLRSLVPSFTQPVLIMSDRKLVRINQSGF